MKNRASFLAALVSVSLVALWMLSYPALSGSPPPGKAEAPAAGSESLPAALDAFYPPKTARPVFLLEMVALGHPFAGIVADLMEGDPANALANFEEFRVQYQKVAGLVPEWEPRFPAAPLGELEAALATGDQDQVMGAMEKVGRVCADCHLTAMPAAHYRYHWGEFQAITITDPLSKQEMDFRTLMQALDGGLTATALNVRQGQVENARKQLQGLTARYAALEETCLHCHDTERKYYVDPGIDAILGQLATALKDPAVKAETVAGLCQTIGMESCHKCHLVHVPAAFAQLRRSSAKAGG